MERKLTSDEWKIYNYLKDHTHEYVTERRIADTLFHEEWRAQALERGQPFHDLPIRHKITEAIRHLNESSVIQKIILSTKQGIKIADKDDIDKYIGGQINAVIRRLNRLKKIAKKASMDGQCKITFGKYERAVIEAFPKDE